MIASGPISLKRESYVSLKTTTILSGLINPKREPPVSSRIWSAIAIRLKGIAL
jgi:hypothetical protein